MMSENGIRRTYWIVTSLLAIVMFYAGVLDVSHSPDLLEALDRLGDHRAPYCYRSWPHLGSALVPDDRQSRGQGP